MRKPPIAPLGTDANGASALRVRAGGAYPHTENKERGLAALPDWDDLRVLLSVVQTGSFSRTAKALNLTQPTVSRRVARLEELLGAQLVDRSHKGAALTLEGQRIIEELHVAYGAIDRAVNRSRPPLARREALTLLTTDGLAAYWLPRFLPFLFADHPDIELRAITASDASILERAKFDLMIHYMQPNDPNLMTVRLGTLHFTPFASPSYLAQHGAPRSSAELADHRLLDYSLYLIDKGTWMTRLPAMAKEARAQLFTNSSAALAESVRHGAGIALLPTYGLVFERGFEALDIGLNFATPFWLCFSKDTLAKPSARAAIHFLKHIFNRRTMPWFADQFVSPADFSAVSPADIMASFRALDMARAAVAAG